MKILKNYLWALFIALISASFISCSDDDNKEPSNPDTDLTGKPHFDIWVSIGSTSGMGSSNTQLVKSIESLEGDQTIDFDGTGVDVTPKLYQESIIKGQYYYQIPKENDRFGKYQISNKEVKIIKEVAFGQNTYKDRRYTHTWIDNNTFVVLAANGSSNKVLWTKIDAENMKILDEGELNLPTLPEGGKFSTSGLAGFRSSDNKILYSYVNNNDKVRFYLAFINPSDMAVEKVVVENRAESMAGTAYGELLQDKTFFDANGDYYIACGSRIEGATSSTQQYGTLLRVKNGETEFDQSYVGFQGNGYSRGKIVTAESLTSGKALLYIMDPTHTGAASWGSDYNCYYAILDLTTDALTELNLPYSEGNFSQRSTVVGKKAYIGVNPKESAPCVYVYNVDNGSLQKEVTIKEGYSFDRIVVLD